MKYLVEAAKIIIGEKRFEEWLDNHSDKLNQNVNSLEEAKRSIYNALQKINKES